MKILIIGLESTGKTTLCNSIAHRYRIYPVKEFGRFYTEDLIDENFHHIVDEDFFVIAKTQQAYIKAAIEHFSSVVVDTDAFVTANFYKMFTRLDGSYKDDIYRKLLEFVDIDYDIVFNLSPKSEPVQDGTRFFIKNGKRINQDIFVNHSFHNKGKVKYKSFNLRGTYEENEREAFKIIDLIIEKNKYGI